jgi:uracil DNA glycosylase
VVILINYVYTDTESKAKKPKGEGWEYWSDRVLLDEQGQEVERVAVWRRDADVYGDAEVEQQ